MLEFLFFWRRKKKGPKKANNAVLNPGFVLGRYTITKKLSNGGFGVVYLAQRNDGVSVALKEFLPSVIACRTAADKGQIVCRDPTDALRFEKGLKAFFREADMLAQVHNSRIIPIWDVFKANGTAYFAMPVERGGTLHAAMRSNILSEHQLQDIFIQACKGVEALHAKSLLHLDIKPSNMWLRPDNSVLILDLGASRWEDEEMKNVQMSRTPGFAAPEQHDDKKIGQLGVRTDVYALCASLLTCLMGTTPIPANQRFAGAPVISSPQLGQSSSELLRIINKGMSLQPELRFKTVADLRRELERAPRLMHSQRWPERLSKVQWEWPARH